MSRLTTTCTCAVERANRSHQQTFVGLKTHHVPNENQTKDRNTSHITQKHKATQHNTTQHTEFKTKDKRTQQHADDEQQTPIVLEMRLPRYMKTPTFRVPPPSDQCTVGTYIPRCSFHQPNAPTAPPPPHRNPDVHVNCSVYGQKKDSMFSRKRHFCRCLRSWPWVGRKKTVCESRSATLTKSGTTKKHCDLCEQMRHQG